MSLQVYINSWENVGSKWVFLNQWDMLVGWVGHEISKITIHPVTQIFISSVVSTQNLIFNSSLQLYFWQQLYYFYNIIELKSYNNCYNI
jgi:hypothetical protein